eukprot:364841-Chlamydomonas_euryale.AAC.1
MKRPSTRCHTRCRGMGVNGLREAPPSFSLNVITQITYVLRVHVRNYVSKFEIRAYGTTLRTGRDAA